MKTLCVVLAVSAFITLIYFISTFTSYGVKNPDFNNDRCQLYNKRISRVGPKDVNDLTGYNMEDHLVCGAGPWGSFGWLLPMIVILVFDVSNAYFLKKPIGFRVSAILWVSCLVSPLPSSDYRQFQSILGALALFTLVTISLLIWIIWAKLWQYSDTMLVCNGACPWRSAFLDLLQIIIVLWIFSVPAIVIIGLYAYSLFKCVQILLLEQTQAIVTPVQS